MRSYSTIQGLYQFIVRFFQLVHWKAPYTPLSGCLCFPCFHASASSYSLIGVAVETGRWSKPAPARTGKTRDVALNQPVVDTAARSFSPSLSVQRKPKTMMTDNMFVLKAC